MGLSCHMFSLDVDVMAGTLQLSWNMGHLEEAESKKMESTALIMCWSNGGGPAYVNPDFSLLERKKKNPLLLSHWCLGFLCSLLAPQTIAETNKNRATAEFKKKKAMRTGQ